ncbi:MAG: penicillin-binding protein activator [Burkholderiales bacterium]|nr:penicillin-binding protein activator [Burkholderiales bacterium]
MSAAQSAPASEASPPEQKPAPTVDIALVLPLDAPAYARAADAVRTGFLDAVAASGTRLRARVFAHGVDGVLTAFEDAQRAGAKVIVGPLLRDDLKTVAAMAIDLPFTVALNQLDEAAGPPTLYTFALSVDSDARQIARRIRESPAAASANAAPATAIVTTDTPLMRRFATAFTAEWMTVGGSVPSVFRFEGKPDAMAAMRRELLRQPPAAALLAMDGVHASLVKPYLGVIPAYASALVFERDTTSTPRDLDGLIVTEIPWIITPNAPQFAGLPKREFASAPLTRLYALGLDALRIALSFREGAPERFSLEGATGQVTLEGRQFLREGRFGVFREGQLQPLDGPR